MSFSRREFIGSASALIAGAGLATSPVAGAVSAASRVAPSDRLNFGVIGVRGMGWSNLEGHIKIPGVTCTALCDVDANVLSERAAQLEQINGRAPATYRDYREMLDDRDIDFVIIATPDHWHCLQMVHACEAGKDVFVEKPLANSIAECDIMVRAAERYNRVVTVGQWQRSNTHWQDALTYVQDGHIGRVRLVKAWAYMGWMKSIPPQPDQPAPEHVDYDMWLGPAAERPFNPNRFHFNFRWFWDYAGGLMTDWGVHLIDMALLGMNAAEPNSVMSSGGKFAYPDDAAETPDTQQAIYEFDDFSMIWEHAVGIDNGPYGRGHGVAFIGNEGTLVVDRGGWEVIPEVEDGQYKTPAIPPRRGQRTGVDPHAENFIECIKTRARPNAPVDSAANTAVVAHLGNVAFKVGRRVTWDNRARRFVNDPEADDIIRPDYRDPYTLPSV
ncbi:MAG: Gfo/Idh/MocA family protein [Bacteroidota bacterium]